MHRYRPIRDAAYALGQPQAAHPFLERLAEPAPGPAATATSSEQGRYVRPGSLTEALTLLAAEPDAQLVAGSTDWGVELNIRGSRVALTVGIDRIPELREFSVTRDHIDVGAALSLTEVEARLAGRAPLLGQLHRGHCVPACPRTTIAAAACGSEYSDAKEVGRS